MKKAELNEIVKDGQARGKHFLVVKIITEGAPAPEIILNPEENFRSKIAYYNKAYNDNLELISALENGKRIYIEDAIATSNLNDLNWFCY